jgi:archaellum component FlaC
MSPLTERCSENFVKKLIGRTDIEDALKKLDKLTQEEVRMAVAQNLKATHTVDERVKGVATTVVAIEDRVAGVDDRVAGVDDRVARVDDRVTRVDDKVASIDDKVTSVNDKVASVDNKVAGVDDKVASINDKVANVNDRVTGVDDNVKGIDARVAIVDDSVKVVDDKVTEVIHGAEIIFGQACGVFNLNLSDGKEAKQVIKQTANDVDLVKRLSSPSILTFHYRDRLHLVGDQLRLEVQHWLSPPDPSTNQNFVQKARHSGTAEWFFESNALAEWKARGSLLWIHGKRMFSELTTSALH